MIKKISKSALLLFLSILCSTVLLFSVTIANYFVKGGVFRERKYVVTEVKTVAPDEIKKQPKAEQKPRQALRAKTTARAPKAGPRFAMSLGALGNAGGASISDEFISNISGGDQGATNGNGDVDEKPISRGYPQFIPPQSIKEAEINATLRLSFCVDERGKAYNIRIIEEFPSGQGLSQAGTDALSKMTFNPAKKDGRAVSFCGMEQPFEIKFRD